MRGKSFIAGLVLAAVADVSASKPNIVVILTDDIGSGDISCFNPQSGYKTPAIDALAKEGMVFRQAHSTAAVCAPSRYAVLTGNYVFRGTNPAGTWTHCCPSQIRPGQMTLADVLRKDGYRTAFLGKLHLGNQFYRRGSDEPADLLREADLARPMFDGPRDHGFDYSLTLVSGIQHSPHAFFENDRLSRWNPESNRFDVFETDADARKVFQFKTVKGLTEDKVKKTWDENYSMDNYVTEQVGPILAFKALEFIDQQVENHPDQPFYIHFCAEAAHYPWAPPVDLSPDDPDNWDKPGKYPIAGKTPTVRADMVYETSVITGVIVERLKQLGIYDNTIIVYTSDNGAAQYTAGSGGWRGPDDYCFKWGYFGGDRIDSDPDRSGSVKNPQGVTDDGRPLRGQKGDIYEGGHRVPLVIAGPGVQQGQVNGQMVGLHDLFATLCELAGVNIPKDQALDSVSFAAALTGRGKNNERTDLMTHGRIPIEYEQAKVAELAASKGWKTVKENGFIIRVEGKGALSPRKLSQRMESDRLGRAVYSEENGRRWKLVFSANKEDPSEDLEAWGLYEMKSDPQEKNNLISNPEQKSRIQSMLTAYRKKVSGQ